MLLKHDRQFVACLRHVLIARLTEYWVCSSKGLIYARAALEPDLARDIRLLGGLAGEW